RRTCSLSAHLDFQTAERRFRLLAVAGSIHFSIRSIPQLPPVRPRTLEVARCLDCVAPISFLERKFQWGAPESVHALASVPHLRRARERTSNVAPDVSPDI